MNNLRYILSAACFVCGLALSAAVPAGLVPGKVTGDVKIGREWSVYGPYQYGESPATLLLKNKKLPEVLKIGKISQKRKIAVPANGHLDLKKLFERKSGKGAYVCIPLHSDRGGKGIFGLSADWYFNAWLNGKLVYSTGDDGNMVSPPQQIQQHNQGDLL